MILKARFSLFYLLEQYSVLVLMIEINVLTQNTFKTRFILSYITQNSIQFLFDALN